MASLNSKFTTKLEIKETNKEGLVNVPVEVDDTFTKYNRSRSILTAGQSSVSLDFGTITSAGQVYVNPSKTLAVQMNGSGSVIGIASASPMFIRSADNKIFSIVAHNPDFGGTVSVDTIVTD